MKTQICAIKDRASDAYSQPMFMPSVGIAIRSFSDEINKEAENNQLYNHPDDFDLWHLGEYDDNGAKFTIFDEAIQLAIGKQVKILKT
jgi:hypothetical protein